MTSARTHIRFVGAAAALLLGAAACGRSNSTMDTGLQQDLAAVGTANSALVITSPLELAPEGAKPQAAPTPKAHAPKAAPRSAAPKAPTHVARAETPAPEPEPVVTPQAPTVNAEPTPEAVIPAAAPAPAPTRTPTAAPAQAPAQQPHRGPYKTEAQIFQQMPWIRP
jgi:hypothetical protein